MTDSILEKKIEAYVNEIKREYEIGSNEVDKRINYTKRAVASFNDDLKRISKPQCPGELKEIRILKGATKEISRVSESLMTELLLRCFDCANKEGVREINQKTVWKVITENEKFEFLLQIFTDKEIIK